MKNRLWAVIPAFALLLAGCSQTPAEEENLHILATTYPVYLFTTALTEGIDEVEVSLLVNSQTSCLHDYTLTVKDMKAIEKADIIVMNGAGLEEFMEDALATSDAVVIDCSEGVELLPTLEHHGHDGHDHEEEYDPHFWMEPERACQMVNNIAQGLFPLLPPQSGNPAVQDFSARWTGTDTAIDTILYKQDTSPLTGQKFITFHDGFQYFAQALGLDLLKAIEEEEGATASAAEIKEVVALIEEYHIPAIFVEKNGSSATAEVIARETGCGVYELDMLMSGDGSGIQAYLDAMSRNLETILEALP